ncbi:MAG: rod shape-determining protein [Kiritimatiellae bacterium]|jgi:rod shape-determining protein MreB|nr:rod shape-determining protein [Kiritimatiellia bacterium]
MLGIFKRLMGALSCDIGIDLGTANTLVFIKGQGVVIREPSVVAMQQGTKKILAVGAEAKRMLGRTPGNIVAVRPMKSGVIADFEITEAMIRYFISKARNHKMMQFLRPRVVIATPSEITEVERRAVKEAATHAGARDVTLIEEPMAAAIGVGLPVEEPAGNLIVDIGGGTCEVALISLAGIAQAKSVRVGGDTMDDCIMNYMRRVYNLLIGERMAEDIKVSIGSAYPLKDEMSMEVRGRDLVAGLPKTLLVGSEEIREALKDPVTAIVDAVRAILNEAKPELASDLVDRGIVLSGGSALLRGLDRLIAAQTGLPVIVADDPLSGVANGTGRVLDELDFYKAHTIQPD